MPFAPRSISIIRIATFTLVAASAGCLSVVEDEQPAAATGARVAALDQSASCVGFCGDIDGDSPASCFCDAPCVEYGDCCDDYLSVCAPNPTLCLPLSCPEGEVPVDVDGDGCDDECDAPFCLHHEEECPPGEDDGGLDPLVVAACAWADSCGAGEPECEAQFQSELDLSGSVDDPEGICAQVNEALRALLTCLPTASCGVVPCLPEAEAYAESIAGRGEPCLAGEAPHPLD